MNDRQNISIRIADLAAMPLSIERNDEETYRIAESNVNQLYSTWRQRFKEKSSREVLAMVAFQFAKLYFTAKASNQAAAQLLEDLGNEFDKLIDSVDDIQD